MCICEHRRGEGLCEPMLCRSEWCAIVCIRVYVRIYMCMSMWGLGGHVWGFVYEHVGCVCDSKGGSR